MIGMLRDLKGEMTGLRTELKEIKENWELKMERIERKMIDMEEKLDGDRERDRETKRRNGRCERRK